MRRISIRDMKIEHRIPQSVDTTKQLDYRNMLGVCNGGEGMDKKNTTCDTHKGDATISIDSQNKRHIDSITYSSATGEIHSSNTEMDMDLCDTLRILRDKAGMTQVHVAERMDVSVNTMHVREIRKRASHLKKGDRLKLVLEPDNKFDEKAILVKNKRGGKLGYILQHPVLKSNLKEDIIFEVR